MRNQEAALAVVDEQKRFLALVALILPWAFDHYGTDPAFGSGPLATVTQDLLSIVIHFAIALAVVS